MVTAHCKELPSRKAHDTYGEITYYIRHLTSIFRFINTVGSNG